MIYLDNAATSFPKPHAVRRAIIESLDFSANPGRAGHSMSMRASEEVYKCRSEVADFFNVKSVENVILTPGCTFALNTVIKGTLKKGDHVVISSYEHNSVVRPLQRLSDEGIINYSVAMVYDGDDDKTIDSFRNCINKNTRLVICTHASNVFGVKLPVSRIAALCKYYGILFCLDAAQTAGVETIDINELGVDFLCAPAHKGLYGTMGTGILIINTDKIPEPLCEGGTGSGSLEIGQPLALPDRFESGTINLSGICALRKGISFVKQKTTDKIRDYEMNLMHTLYSELSKNKEVILYTHPPVKHTHVPILSFNLKDKTCEEVAAMLDRRFLIAVRAGIHCSPLAHRTMGTDTSGTVRVAPSAFTTKDNVHSLIRAVNIISKTK